VLGYTLESKVRPLHQGYVSVTALYLALSSEKWKSWVWLPRSGFSLNCVSTSSTKYLSPLISAFNIFVAHCSHTLAFYF